MAWNVCLLCGCWHGQEVDKLLADALMGHHRSGLLHLFAAQYISIYHQNRHIERLQLNLAEVRC